MSAAVGSDDAARYKKLITSAKAECGAGRLKKALELFRKAYEIQPSDKLQRRISKVQEILNKDSESESDSDSDTKMVHVGNGFYLHETIYGQLYTHQREGVLYLFNLYKRKKGGILGDDMGLGKTIQVIAFLSGMYDADLIKSVLIVAPVAVLVNWAQEFEKWAPGINVHDFHDHSNRLQILTNCQRRGGVLLTTYGIIVTCADQLGRDRHGRDFIWDYVILDEGHKIKNPANRCAKGVHNIPARNRIVLTGTPLMNNLKELWSLFDWTHEGRLLGTAATFAQEYEKPIMRSREKCATAGEQRLGHEMSVNLKSLIKPYILRRTKADVGILEASLVPGGTGSAPKMPTLTRKNDLIVWVYLSDTQRQIYSDFLEKPEIQELLVSKRSPLCSLTVLKKLCDHPRLMKNRHCNELGLEIAPDVDIDKLDAAAEADPTLFDVSHVPDRLLIQESGKMQFLVKLLDNLKEEGHRCLIFSSSRRMLDIVEKVMRGKGHRMCRLDGRIRGKEERQVIISRFTRDLSYSSFLLTTQVGGVGLTLTAADRVVIIDPSWNPATDSQAVDRAYRIGQKENVVVYRLITCGTVEEKIYRRQIFKDSVNRQTTGDSKNPVRYFSRQELKELFCLDDPTRSTTQQQLAEMHSGRRRTDTSLDAHIAFLYSLEMFGISDHDLMFTVDAANVIEGAADKGDMDIEYVRQKVSQAQSRLDTESRQNELMAKETGKYMPIIGKEFGRMSIVSKATKEAAAGAAGINIAELEMMRRQRYMTSDDDDYGSGSSQYNATLVRDHDSLNTVQPFEESVATAILLHAEQQQLQARKPASRIADDDDDDDVRKTTPVRKHVPMVDDDDEDGDNGNDRRQSASSTSVGSSPVVNSMNGDETVVNGADDMFVQKPAVSRKLDVDDVDDDVDVKNRRNSNAKSSGRAADDENDVDVDDEVIAASMGRKRAPRIYDSDDDTNDTVNSGATSQEGDANGRSPIAISDDDECQPEGRRRSSVYGATRFDPALCSTFTDEAASYREKQALRDPVEDTIASKDDNETIILSEATTPRRDTPMRRRRRSSALLPISTALGLIASGGKKCHPPVVMRTPYRSYGVPVKPVVATQADDDDDEQGRTVMENKNTETEMDVNKENLEPESDTGPSEGNELTTVTTTNADITSTTASMETTLADVSNVKKSVVQEWNELMTKCKMLYREKRFVEAYKCGKKAMKIHDGNDKANNFVSKIENLLDQAVDKDENAETSSPAVGNDSKNPVADNTAVANGEGESDQSEQMEQGDDGGDDNDDEEEEDMDDEDEDDVNSEDEQRYVALLADSKRMYRNRDFRGALRNCDLALQIVKTDENVHNFRQKLISLLNAQKSM